MSNVHSAFSGLDFGASMQSSGGGLYLEYVSETVAADYRLRLDSIKAFNSQSGGKLMASFEVTVVESNHPRICAGTTPGGTFDIGGNKNKFAGQEKVEMGKLKALISAAVGPLFQVKCEDTRILDAQGNLWGMQWPELFAWVVQSTTNAWGQPCEPGKALSGCIVRCRAKHKMTKQEKKPFTTLVWMQDSDGAPTGGELDDE